MKIRKIHSKIMRNDEHFQLHTENITLINQCGIAKLNIQDLYDAYSSSFNDEDTSIKKIEKSDYTYRIKNADKERDKIYSSIVLINKGNLNHFVPEIKAAAHRTKIVFDTYGNISKKAFNEQTSAVISILQEFRGKYQNDINTLGLNDWVNELERTNNIVMRLIRERSKETAKKTPIVLKHARLKVDAAFKNINEKINAAALLEGPQNYERYINGINEIINRYTNIIKAREGRAAKKNKGKE